MATQQEETRSEWTAAEARGAKLAAIRANLALTPAERIAELVAMNHFHHAVQSRTLSQRQLAALDAREVERARARLREAGE